MLEREPDWSALPNATPPAARGLLRRCLEKDPKRRLRDIGDAQRECDDALEQGNATAVSPFASSRVWIAAAVLGLLTAITVSVIHFRETPARRQTLLYEISAPENESIELFAISPDGRHLAFTTGRLGGTPADNFNRLWVRPFDSLEAKPLRGTEGAWDLFWSADSRSIGFFAQGKLKRVDLLGGPPQIVCDAPRQSGGAWNQAGNILFTGARGALNKVSAAGRRADRARGVRSRTRSAAIRSKAGPQTAPRQKVGVLRVVLDANVYVSALIRPQGPPGQILTRFLENSFEIVLSPAIVEETVRAFAYPKVRKYIRAGVDPELWFEDVILLAQFVAGDYEVEGVSVDADDDKYLAAAAEGGATLIVTGDPDLLTVKEFQGIRIVTPRVFLDLLSG